MPPAFPPPSLPPPFKAEIESLNRRFRSEGFRRSGPLDLSESGVLIHHFDGWQNPDDPWQPCNEDGGGPLCRRDYVRDKAGHTSASLLFAGVRHDAPHIPIFSYDGGLILRPQIAARAINCAYPIDAGTDYGSDTNCHNQSLHL